MYIYIYIYSDMGGRVGRGYHMMGMIMHDPVMSILGRMV